VSWRVNLARDAKKELARLPAAVQKRVARVLLSLEEDPFPAGCKKLKNRDGWRVRVGDYRILYFADIQRVLQPKSSRRWNLSAMN
jgi:mRNA interferase RelE/StbE